MSGDAAPPSTNSITLMSPIPYLAMTLNASTSDDSCRTNRSAANTAPAMIACRCPLLSLPANVSKVLTPILHRLRLLHGELALRRLPVPAGPAVVLGSLLLLAQPFARAARPLLGWGAPGLRIGIEHRHLQELVPRLGVAAQEER